MLGFSNVCVYSGGKLDYFIRSSDEDDFFDDVDLINDLIPVELATGSNASASDWGSSTLEPVTLTTIHNDIQLLTVTILLIYVIAFVLFIARKWR